MGHLCRESRHTVDPIGHRWSLFDRRSPQLISTGSLIKLTHRVNMDRTAVSLVGVLLAIRRSPANPTILVRGVVDDVAVEQIFCIFSPLLEKIEVLKAAERRCARKLYSLREKPEAILELQRSMKMDKPAK